MKIAIYSRKSIFTGKGESIGNQIELCKQYIYKNINEVKENDIFIYEDEGYSGKNTDRPQFQAMMNQEEKEPFDYVICYRLDRISRHVGDFSDLIESLHRLNTHFICIKEQFDTSTPMGRAMMYIASVFAQLERETIAERVRDNMVMLARTGRWLGGTPPLGYVSVKEKSTLVDGKQKQFFKLKTNTKEIKIAKLIFSNYLSCFSLSGVCKKLINMDIKSRSGKYYTPIGIREILTNPIYCIADLDSRKYFIDLQSDVCFNENDCNGEYGLAVYNKRNYTIKNAPRQNESKWIIAIGKHNGIINGLDWIKIQNKINSNKQNNKKNINAHNKYALFSGMIFCKKCGSRMFAKIRHNTKNTDKVLFDYICSNKLRGNKNLCDCKNLNGLDTDKKICDYILNMNTETVNINNNFEKYRIDIKREIELKNNQIEKLNSQIKNLIDTMSEKTLNLKFIQYIQSQVEELDNKINKLKLEKNTLILKINDENKYNSCRDIVNNLINNFRDSFNTLTISQKRESIKLIVDHIEWDEKNINIFIFGK